MKTNEELKNIGPIIVYLLCLVTIITVWSSSDIFFVLRRWSWFDKVWWKQILFQGSDPAAGPRVPDSIYCSRDLILRQGHVFLIEYTVPGIWSCGRAMCSCLPILFQGSDPAAGPCVPDSIFCPRDLILRQGHVLMIAYTVPGICSCGKAMCSWYCSIYCSRDLILRQGQVLLIAYTVPGICSCGRALCSW